MNPEKMLLEIKKKIDLYVYMCVCRLEQLVACWVGKQLFSGDRACERVKKKLKHTKQKYNEIRQMLHDSFYLYSECRMEEKTS